MLFFSRIQAGKLLLNNIKNFNDFLASQKDGVYEIRIKKWRKKRSLQQNNLYWLWIGIIAKDTGYDGDELHTTFRGMFLTDESKKLPLIRSTTALTTMEFGQYLGKIERKMADMGISLPHPEEY